MCRSTCCATCSTSDPCQVQHAARVNGALGPPLQRIKVSRRIAAEETGADQIPTVTQRRSRCASSAGCSSGIRVESARRSGRALGLGLQEVSRTRCQLQGFRKAAVGDFRSMSVVTRPRDAHWQVRSAAADGRRSEYSRFRSAGSSCCLATGAGSNGGHTRYCGRMRSTPHS